MNLHVGEVIGGVCMALHGKMDEEARKEAMPKLGTSFQKKKRRISHASFGKVVNR